MPTTYPKLTVSHDRITLNLGNGCRLNSSRYSDTASGEIPQAVFDAWLKLRDNLPAGCATFGEACQHFADNIATIWPEWNAPVPSFNVGDRVKWDRPVCGCKTGVVISKRGSTYTVKIEDNLAGKFPAQLLKSV
jgi:hypothetical protein